MSALGEYIHLYYKNYKKYGVSRTGPKTSDATDYSVDVINQRIRNNTPKISDGALSLLKQRLKANSHQKLDEYQKDWEVHQKALIYEILGLLEERASTVSGLNRVQSILNGQGWVTEENGDTKMAYRATTWGQGMSFQELRNRHNKAKTMYTQITELIKKIKSDGQPQSSENLKKLIQLFEEYTHLSGDSLQSCTVGEIETAIGQHRYDGTYGNIAGKFGEMLVAICDDTAESIGEEEIATFIQEHVKGDQRTNIIVPKNALIGAKRKKFFFKTTTQDGTSYSISKTQNKVDTQIKIKNEDMFATIKTTATKTGEPNERVHSLQEVNLLYPLMFLNDYQNYIDLGNHWLNLHVTHGYGRTNSNRPGQKNLDEIVKKEVAYEALSSGNPFKTGVNSANVFISINIGTGSLFIKNTQDMLLLDNLKSFQGLDNISNIFLENHKAHKVQDRIYNIINQLHQHKLQISYSVNFNQT